jgi:hypothetical protein
MVHQAKHRGWLRAAPDRTPARVFLGALAPARYLMRNRCTMRGRTAGNDRNDPDWLGPSRVSLGIQCRRNTVDRYRRAHACSGTGRRAPGPTVEQSRQNSLRRLARRPSRRCRCRAGCAGFGAELLTLMPDHSLGLGDFLLCPALHVDLLAERGDRLPELLAGRLDVSPHFVDAGVGARLFVRCCHSPAALTVWMSCLTLSTDFCTGDGTRAEPRSC